MGLAQKTISFEPVRANYFRIRSNKKFSEAILSAKAQTDRWQEKASYFSEFIDNDMTPEYSEGTIKMSSIIRLDSLILSYTLGYDLMLFILWFKVVQLWSLRALSVGASVPLAQSHCWEDFLLLCFAFSPTLLSGTIRCFRLIISPWVPSPRNNHFFKEPGFFLLNSINCGLLTGC